jgi:hypothetical protein
MPISQQDLNRGPARRESADGDGDGGSDQQVSNVLSALSSSAPPNQLHSHEQSYGDRLLSRKLSEESIRTELCDGPIPDSPLARTPEDNNNSSPPCTDRADLIERLKRGESPTWIPYRHVREFPLSLGKTLSVSDTDKTCVFP